MPKKYTYTRINKGHNLLECHRDYIVIDIETTGLDPKFDSIIEISALKVVAGKITNEFSSLIKPDNFLELDEYITDLTGITNEMLENAPSLDEILPLFRNFIGNAILVGHNVNFDINFLYDLFILYFDTPLTNDFIDTMRLSRLVFKNEKHHKLPDIARYCQVEYENGHRALFDCHITQKCYETLCTQIPEINTTKCKSAVKISEIHPDNLHIDENNPFFDRTVVFTGKLDGITRKEAMQMVVNVGGYISDSISNKTDFLVIGSLEYAASIKDGKSKKIKDAEKRKLEGNNIEIISQNVFLDMFFQ